MGGPRLSLEDAIENVLRSSPPITEHLTDKAINSLVVELTFTVRERLSHLEDAFTEVHERFGRLL